MIFIYMIYEQGALPFSHDLFPGFAFGTKLLLWLTLDDRYLPAIAIETDENGETDKKSIFPADDEEKVTPFKYFKGIIYFFILLVLQFVFVISYVVWTMIFSPFLVFWLLLGIFFFQTKVIAIGRIWNFWFETWSGKQAYSIDVIVDTSLLNESLLAEFMMETLPQLIIQFWNTQLIGAWSPVGYFSTMLSILIAFNGLYRYGYYSFWRGIHIDVTTFILNYTLHYSYNKHKTYIFF